MKAISPVRSVRSCYEAVCCLSEQSLAIARGGNNKSPALEEPMNLLYDMNDCYSKLRELVPGIPQGTKVSQVEILQHVIDYIFDLQIVLEEGAKGRDPSSEATLFSLKVRVVLGWGGGGYVGLEGDMSGWTGGYVGLCGAVWRGDARSRRGGAGGKGRLGPDCRRGGPEPCPRSPQAAELASELCSKDERSLCH